MTPCIVNCCLQSEGVAPKGTETGDLETTKVTQAVTQGNDAPKGSVKEASLVNGEPEEDSMPPNLETFISGECLPDALDAFANPTLLGVPSHLPPGPVRLFIERYPIRFVRIYPPPTPTDKDDRSVMLDHPTTCRLDLRYTRHLGSGHHSDVVLAPLTLPSSVATPSVRAAVAVKIAKPHPREREMLLNEAKIYNAFPRELQEGTSHQAPVVPKFYGYYVPSREAFDSQSYDDIIEEDRKVVWNIIRRVTPLLLLEPCGREIRALSLSRTGREIIFGLLDRLHAANFVQGSVYERNILIQPGPLNVPWAERSMQKPSFRIIDFGRGECPSVSGLSITTLASEAKDERENARWRVLYLD
ncbi:hypothetical protein BC827DRAFT_424009 [Russula dissimulans]|nr:hypothetical protein BC827DRAFT_424009 [Russula dissimulans]